MYSLLFHDSAWICDLVIVVSWQCTWIYDIFTIVS